MKSSRNRAFTLIELLTVIAIIAILAALIMVAGPRMIEKAKITRTQNAMNDLRTQLVTYYTEYHTYPPAYGYTYWEMREQPAGAYPDERMYSLRPFMARLQKHGIENLYDEFSESYDTDRDDQLSLLEFSPVGVKDPATNRYTFPSERYTGANNPGDEVGKQLGAEKRPFIYLPVNTRQFEKASRYWIERGYFLAEAWDPSDPLLRAVEFPPPSYDAFVLMSVGPFGSTSGLLPQPLGTESPKDLYHITALRAYFLATRDLNGNGQLDFDYIARTQRGEAEVGEYDVKGRPANNKLPKAGAGGNPGPFILKYPN